MDVMFVLALDNSSIERFVDLNLAELNNIFRTLGSAAHVLRGCRLPLGCRLNSFEIRCFEAELDFRQSFYLVQVLVLCFSYDLSVPCRSPTLLTRLIRPSFILS